MVSDQHDMSAAHAGNKLLRWSLHAKAASNVTRKTTSSSPTNLSLQKSNGRGNKLLRPQLETSNDV